MSFWRHGSRARVLTVAVAVGTVGGLSFAGAPPASAAATGTCSESGTTSITLTCTVGSGTWAPPPGVTSVQVDVEGAGGGGGIGGFDSGGAGGSTTATLAVSSANTYTVLAGGKGHDGFYVDSGKGGGPGGSNGGATGGEQAAGGGGGASEIDLGTSRLVVAGGGGGGAAGGAGGDGGSTSPGTDGGGPAGCTGTGGQPGGAAAAGTGGAGSSSCYSNGAKGTDGSGASGGAGGDGADAGGGGGGGGGYFGGGGGGGGGFDAGTLNSGGGGGGGGGSNFLDSTTTTDGSAGTGTNTGDGSVTITYTLPPSNATPPSVSDQTTGSTTSFRDGDVLVADPGTWNSATTLTYTYLWMRCPTSTSNPLDPISGCVNVHQGASSTFRAGWHSVGKFFAVIVTATDTDNRTSAPAASQSPLLGPGQAPTAPSYQSGARITHGNPIEVGQYVIARHGAWSSPDPLTYSYTWQACTTRVPMSATCSTLANHSSTLLLRNAQKGQFIALTVTATDKEHQGASVTTSTIGPVKAA